MQSNTQEVKERPADKTNKFGFTLIELLVVISIIALLLSIMMPALSKTKEQAKSLLCSANLRQLILTVDLYVLDNNDNFLELGSAFGFYWIDQLAPYIDGYEVNKNSDTFDKGAKFLKIGLCPSAKKTSNDSGNEWIPGTAKNAWTYTYLEGSYGINWWLQYQWDRSMTNSTIGGGFQPYRDRGFFYSKYSKAKSDTPVMVDSMWVNLAPFGEEEPGIPDYYPRNLFDGNFGGGCGRACLDRHDMGVNVAFADSHVDRIKPLKKLWTLKWHPMYKGTSEPPYKGSKRPYGYP